MRFWFISYTYTFGGDIYFGTKKGAVKKAIKAIKKDLKKDLTADQKAVVNVKGEIIPLEKCIEEIGKLDIVDYIRDYLMDVWGINTY